MAQTRRWLWDPIPLALLWLAAIFIETAPPELATRTGALVAATPNPTAFQDMSDKDMSDNLAKT